jgi:hypothetical protein
MVKGGAFPETTKTGYQSQKLNNLRKSKIWATNMTDEMKVSLTLLQHSTSSSWPLNPDSHLPTVFLGCLHLFHWCVKKGLCFLPAAKTYSSSAANTVQGSQGLSLEAAMNIHAAQLGHAGIKHFALLAGFFHVCLVVPKSFWRTETGSYVL